jgi:hypothetical protein
LFLIPATSSKQGTNQKKEIKGNNRIHKNKKDVCRWCKEL